MYIEIRQKKKPGKKKIVISNFIAYQIDRNVIHANMAYIYNNCHHSLFHYHYRYNHHGCKYYHSYMMMMTLHEQNDNEKLSTILK